MITARDLNERKEELEAQKEMKRELPRFSSDEEFAEWVETHDLSEYMDSFEVVTEKIKVRRTREKQSVGLDLNRRDLDAIKRLAKTREFRIRPSSKTG